MISPTGKWSTTHSKIPMTECDHCEEEHDLTFILNDVLDEGEIISQIRSRYVVCASCRNELEENEDITW